MNSNIDTQNGVETTNTFLILNDRHNSIRIFYDTLTWKCTLGIATVLHHITSRNYIKSSNTVFLNTKNYKSLQLILDEQR